MNCSQVIEACIGELKLRELREATATIVRPLLLYYATVMGYYAVIVGHAQGNSAVHIGGGRHARLGYKQDSGPAAVLD